MRNNYQDFIPKGFASLAIFFILQALFPTNLLQAKVVSIKKTAATHYQKIEISGVVTDSTGTPIPGTEIIEKGTENGTATDFDGNYTLSGVDSQSTLIVSSLGYKAKEIAVNGDKTINVTLISSSTSLGKVTVTALGVERQEKSIGYSTQEIKGEELTKVKGTNVGTSLSGKISGLNVQNSTEFDAGPTLLLRGKSPLIVIDDVPYGNTSLSDIPADNIKNISVLKGPAASALYGSRGGNGAIMVTTKRGGEEGLTVNINSNTMLNLGELRKPHPQTSYSTGNNGVYDPEDFVWGDKMDIGRTAKQYNPETYKWEEMPLESKGKNNFKHFTRTAFVTNNDISLAYKGEQGSIRTSLNHIYNKGQFPNLTSNKFNYGVSGEFEVGDFKFDGGINMQQYDNPQSRGSGYGATGYIYNFMVWTGTDFDVRDYKDYWQKGKKGEKQNWWSPVWYDNPYFIAYEETNHTKRNKTHSHLKATYNPISWLKTTARLGHDYYTNRVETHTPMDTRGNDKGAYSVSNSRGYSLNADLLATTNHTIGDFSINTLFGGSIYYYEDYSQNSSTSNGLSIPDFYSLNASNDPVSSSESITKRQLNSLYGQINIGWRDYLFLGINGRNDWVSTLDESNRSYFYPGLDLSFVGSDALGTIKGLSYWKVRGSWSLTKSPAGVYDINSVYSIHKNLWNQMNGAQYPTSKRSQSLRPESKKSWEVGTELHFLKHRLRLDASYYQELEYDLQRLATVSNATGFSSELINYGEEELRKGVELTIEGDLIKSKNFKWTSMLNWSLDRYYYHKVDDQYSTDRPWVAAGKRWDWMGGVYDWKRDPKGNIIHQNGLPQQMEYNIGGFYENPDWSWGFSSSLQYKNFSLHFSFDGRVGGYAYDRTEQAMWNSGTHPDSDNEYRYDQVVNNKTNYVGNGVKTVSGEVKYDKYGRIEEDTREFEPNDVEVGYQEYVQEFNPWSGNRAIQNIHKMTFIKLREVALGYTVPEEFAKKLNLDKLTFSITGQNLWMWSSHFRFSDPDVGSNTGLNSPSIRYVGLNINLSL